MESWPGKTVHVHALIKQDSFVFNDFQVLNGKSSPKQLKTI